MNELNNKKLYFIDQIIGWTSLTTMIERFIANEDVINALTSSVEARVNQ
jgi:hypothetical protein